MSSFNKMVEILAAKNCYEGGQSIFRIAYSAKVSESTVRRWLRKAGVKLRG